MTGWTALAPITPACLEVSMPRQTWNCGLRDWEQDEREAHVLEATALVAGGAAGWRRAVKPAEIGTKDGT